MFFLNKYFMKFWYHIQINKKHQLPKPKAKLITKTKIHTIDKYDKTGNLS